MSHVVTSAKSQSHDIIVPSSQRGQSIPVSVEMLSTCELLSIASGRTVLHNHLVGIAIKRPNHEAKLNRPLI